MFHIDHEPVEAAPRQYLRGVGCIEAQERSEQWLALSRGGEKGTLHVPLETCSDWQEKVRQCT